MINATRPNIVIIHCHDLGRFLGCYGIATVRTPNLDAFAEQSILFESAFATSPHCSPSRASLFTGTYPQSNGVLGLTHAPFNWDLREPGHHLGNRLRELGYHTELIGVHHESRALPDDQLAVRLGFDSARTDSERDTVVERATESLRDAAATGRPFYLQVGFHEPHRSPSTRDRRGVMGFLGDNVEADSSLGVTVPDYLHDDAETREELAELQGAVGYLDTGVGRILDAIDVNGLAESTVVVFTTDHGLALPRAKCTLYDAGLGVALVIRVPGTRAGRVTSAVSHVDIVPTVLDLVDGPPDALEGTSLRPLLENETSDDRPVFGQLTHHTYFDPKRSIRSEGHKLIANFSNAPRVMDPTQSWSHRSSPSALAGATVGSSLPIELYDLAADPGETVNLIGQSEYAAITRRLAAGLLAWMTSTEDPLLARAPAQPRQQETLQLLANAAAAHHDTREHGTGPSRARFTHPVAVRE